MTYGVITACLNSASTIARTIESVLSQPVSPAEYFFVDGGSTDGTLTVIEDSIASSRHKKEQTKFRTLTQTDSGGISGAWNIALREFQADVVFILNSDDWYLPDTVPHVLSQFEADPSIDVIIGAGQYFKSPGDSGPEICHVRSFDILPFAMPIIHPACFVKLGVYRRVGYFDEKYRVSGDFEFINRCHKSGVKFKKIDKILTNVLTGGFAEKNRRLARKEFLEIGKAYFPNSYLPQMAFWARQILNR